MGRGHGVRFFDRPLTGSYSAAVSPPPKTPADRQYDSSTAETRASRAFCAEAYIPADTIDAVLAPPATPPMTPRSRDPETPRYWDSGYGRRRSWSCRPCAPARPRQAALNYMHLEIHRLRRWRR